MSENCADLNKNEYIRLLYESVQLAIKLTNYTGDGWVGDLHAHKARKTCDRTWQRHWRRVAEYNKLFDVNLYIPEWYIADNEVENEHGN